MTINYQSFQAFLAFKGTGSQNRLYIKNKELHYDSDVGCMTLFAAKLGFGSASMSNVAKFIRKNQDTCFAKTKDITTYNDFVVSYNEKQCICWKKAKQIKKLIVTNVRPVLSRDEAHLVIKDHIDTCKLLIKDTAQHPLLIQTCGELKEVMNGWSLDGNITKEEKKTLNSVLALKNQLRNSFFPIKFKALKGAQEPQIFTTLSDADKNALRKDLKDIRTLCLKKYFHERLKNDQADLIALKSRFNRSFQFQDPQYLKNQLDRWEKKLDQGKPIAIPKWYHCTKESETMDAILKTDILYMHKGMYAGAFVSNKPELGSNYGKYCLMLSNHIEKTGTKRKNDKTPLYPKQSSFSGNIFYADTPRISNNLNLINNQEQTKIWLGFQRGNSTLNRATGLGTEGIPMQLNEKIQSGNLKYYKDTTVAFIFNSTNDHALQKIGRERRIQVITYAQATDLQKLINGTFCYTLPSSWKGNIQSCI